MKDSREKLIKRFLCAKTNTKSFKVDAPLGDLRENKLYFFLLHEDFYPVLFQNTEAPCVGPFEKSSYVLRQNNIKKYTKSFSSFLTIKYVIFLFRSNKFSDLKRSFFSHTRFYEKIKDDNLLQRKKKSIFYLIVESITFLLLCSQQKKSAGVPVGRFEKSLLITKHISISIQKPLVSIENQWQYFSFGLKGSFCHFFHPEVVVRILRKKIQDISFLHLIRNFLHSNFPRKAPLGYLSDNYFNRSEAPLTKIKNILWNIYVLELDNFFLTDCKYYSTSDKWIYASSNFSLSCFQKMNEWTYFVPKEKYKDFTESKIFPYKVLHTNNICNSEEQGAKRKSSFLAQSSTYKYLRTNTSWFLFLQKEKSWNCLIKRRIIQFFTRRLGYIFSKNTINSCYTLSSKYNRAEVNSYFFLAYILQFTKKRNFVKINTKLFFLINYFVKRVVSFINPFFLIILILSKQNFCNSVGYPKSKSGWVTWTDIDIIQHFNRIINSIFLFYSGCNNKKALSRLQYILHFSCAKTLACKHKTNLRQISKKFAVGPLWRNNFRNKDCYASSGPTAKEPAIFFVSNQSKNSRLRSLFINQKMSRVWNYHLTQMDSIIFLLEDFSTLIKV